MSKRGKRQHRAAKRRAALRAATVDASAGASVADPAAAQRPPPAKPAPRQPSESRQRAASWPIIGVAAAAVLGLAVLAAMAVRAPAEQATDVATPTIEVGLPGGAVISQATPTPTARLTADPTATPAPTPVATPVATPAPTAPTTPTPQPTAAATAVPATPAPTAIVVAAAGPEDAVASFYRSVSDGDFDAAYSLWSDRMKVTYPRGENLDGRFAETESISFDSLHTVERTATTATVQANFTEVYEDGGSRQFIGYWRLVLVDGRWLLDEPHY